VTETARTDIPSADIPRVQDLPALRPGDNIEARRNGVTHYFGQVDSAVPKDGILWIREGTAGKPLGIDLTEYSIWLTRPYRQASPN
jgi:hypothetical protein